jgi:hypothetical protein
MLTHSKKSASFIMIYFFISFFSNALICTTTTKGSINKLNTQCIDIFKKNLRKVLIHFYSTLTENFKEFPSQNPEIWLCERFSKFIIYKCLKKLKLTLCWTYLLLHIWCLSAHLDQRIFTYIFYWCSSLRSIYRVPLPWFGSKLYY